ncbi:hypothetical protein V1477_012798 [Vespula maculifrons]|uniref:Uncharacterized protein n=1 Tax=Vespula maculifrons TaxID=7453 RepID=A0ABD2BUK4_VESMC
MPFRFGSFGLLSKLEMYKTPLTDCSTVHTVGFKHLETRPVVSIIHFDISQVLPTQVPPRGGLLFAPENTTSVPADTGVSVLPILPVFRADISRFAKKRKR